jgi:hypothetical protein
MTIDNEPMKYLTREEYINYVNIAYDQIGRRFDVGAGNEEYDLAMHSDNMYEYLVTYPLPKDTTCLSCSLKKPLK